MANSPRRWQGEKCEQPAGGGGGVNHRRGGCYSCVKGARGENWNILSVVEIEKTV